MNIITFYLILTGIIVEKCWATQILPTNDVGGLLQRLNTCREVISNSVINYELMYVNLLHVPIVPSMNLRVRNTSVSVSVLYLLMCKKYY